MRGNHFADSGVNAPRAFASDLAALRSCGAIMGKSRESNRSLRPGPIGCEGAVDHSIRAEIPSRVVVRLGVDAERDSIATMLRGQMSHFPGQLAT